MKPFVQQITQFLLNQKQPLHQWVVVVPSQRSVRYIQKSLFESTGKPMLSPKIITINRFIETISPKHILDKTRLLIRLYSIYCAKTTAENKTFDDFYTWGKILLSDFNEIDNYLVEPKQLFKNLKDIKGIEAWSFNSEELTETQIKFMHFWEELGVYYQAFSKSLDAENLAYAGKAIQEIVNNIDLIFKKYPKEHFLFAGFNAHSPAELSIIKQLSILGKASVLVDSDVYYMSEKTHEAGAFIRNNLSELGISIKNSDAKNNLATKKIDVNIIACAQTTGQVKVAASILELMPIEEINKTLILLAEEDLLVPLLKNIPAKVEKANITLGLSLDNSILKTWIEKIFKIQKGLQKNKAAYHKDLLELFYHPFVEVILSDSEKQELIQFEQHLKTKNLIYIDAQKIAIPTKLKSIIHLIYTNWNNDWALAVATIREINIEIYKQLSSENEYEKALLETFDKSIIDLQNCIHDTFPEMSLFTFKNIFTQQYASQTIAYYGNPIDGLQIMGLLETRMLDFQRIIVIGMNEKNMPPNNQINSLIPMDLRSYFKMPTVREKQGIFAHHFYRLLHEVEELYLTYSTSTQEFNSSEKSRYIMQLELELAHVNPNIKFHYLDYTIQNSQVDVNSKKNEKNEYNLSLIKDYFQHGVSASALGDYFTCTLDFFYKYILGFNNEKKVEEDIESNTFGSLIHKTLEILYTPYANQTLINKPETIKFYNELIREGFRKHIDYELHKQFSEFFNTNEAFKTGKNRLSFEMAKKLSHSFLDYEKKHLQQIQSPIYIESLEQKLTTSLPNIMLNEKGETITLELKGVIDRIDYHNGGFHIIDYKSGKVDYTKFKTDKLDSDTLYKSCKKEKKFLQFYFYLYLFYQNYKIYPQSVTFISFTNINDVKSIQNDGINFEEMIRLFPEIMQRIVLEIYDSNVPFVHNPTDNQRNYCNFCF
jgi:hypothetical protein